MRPSANDAAVATPAEGGAARHPPFYNARFLIAQMAAVLGVVVAMYLMPLEISAPLLGTMYAVMVWRESRYGIHSPISITLLVLYIGLAVASGTMTGHGYAPAAPILVFATLFLLTGTLLLLGRPVTTFHASEYGTPALHWMTSILWTCIYGVGAVLGWIALGRLELYFLPPVFVGAGIVLTLYLHLIDMGRSGRRRPEFSVGQTVFRQLRNDEQHLRPYYEHFVREALPSLRQGSGLREASMESLIDRKMKGDQGRWHQTCFFVALRNERVVGTIACVADDPALGVPAEKDVSESVNFAPLRAYGRIMEVGKFSISKEVRFGQDVIQGLLRCAVEYALERDVAFLVVQTYESTLPIYQKMGFRLLGNRIVYQRDLGVPVLLTAFNLARRVIYEWNANPATDKVRQQLGSYVPERYVKRRALESFFRRRRAWDLSDEEMLALLAWDSDAMAAEGSV